MATGNLTATAIKEILSESLSSTGTSSTKVPTEELRDYAQIPSALNAQLLIGMKRKIALRIGEATALNPTEQLKELQTELAKISTRRGGLGARPEVSKGKPSPPQTASNNMLLVVQNIIRNLREQQLTLPTEEPTYA